MVTHVKAKVMVSELKQGNSPNDLMSKYGLSAKGLRKILFKLIESRGASFDDLFDNSPAFRTIIDKWTPRSEARSVVNIQVPVYDISDMRSGLVRDISLHGLRIAGIWCNVDAIKAFQIPVDLFLQAEPILLTAQCKWTLVRGKTNKYPVAGFKLIEISDTDSRSLQALVSMLRLSESGEWMTEPDAQLSTAALLFGRETIEDE